MHVNLWRLKMPYDTDERLKNYLDTNQLHREQMCLAILSIDKRFSDVRPRHPRGGRDGGRDIEAVFREDQIAYCAVGFMNQVNDSAEQKKAIIGKFGLDLNSAIEAEPKPKTFIFLTNINLTIGEKDELIESAKKKGILFCEILDRERLRIALDGPDGFSIRFQYLNIPLSEAEQASFFARWGDDIQSVISTGFQRVENTLKRILFLHEAHDVLEILTISFQLDKNYSADEINHFRLFCILQLKEPKQNILSILFGASDKRNRMQNDLDFSTQPSGVKNGIGTGQWEKHINLEADEEADIQNGKGKRRYVSVGSGAGIGKNEVESIGISYHKGSLIRFDPSIVLRDLDEAMFLPFMNKSLADKIKSIYVYSNGYKLKEVNRSEFYIDDNKIEPDFPVKFTDEELADQWVSIRPNNASAFNIRFFEETPLRMFVPTLIKDTIVTGKI
jgi:hypothetical protein